MMAMQLVRIFCLFNGLTGALSANVPLPSFNDPGFREQFYLNEKFGVTMNIYKAWNKGYTGKNVTICIHDPSGMEKDHSELSSRFVIRGSYNYKTNTSDPTPDSGGTTDGPDAHGTQMAGVAAASAGNGICGVGVAHGASVSGIKLFLSDPLKPASNELKESRLAKTMEYGIQTNDIFSCSWGTMDMFETIIGAMSQVVRNAVKKSVETGRGGKGNIYVFAGGNGGTFNGTCGYDEYVTSIYTIGINVVTGKNVPSRQNVECAAISAVTYARDMSLGIDNPNDLMPTCGTRNSCSKTTGASSAAAAVASGLLALVLQANPNLGWRDMQHLIAQSSSSSFNSVSWMTNKAGIKVSDQFGFGLLDADALTTNAKSWTNVGPHLECRFSVTTPEPIDGVQTTKKIVDLSTWPTSCGGEAKRINYLEHVVLDLSLNFTLRRNIEIEVISPGGTKSIILRSGRRFDRNKEIKKLSTMSLQFWGENPGGSWEMNWRNVKQDASQSGTFHNWTLTFYGTSGNPLAANKIVRSKIMTNSARTVSPITMTTNTPISTSTNTQLPMTKDTLIPTTSEAFPTNDHTSRKYTSKLQTTTKGGILFTNHTSQKPLSKIHNMATTASKWQGNCSFVCSASSILGPTLLISFTCLMQYLLS